MGKFLRLRERGAEVERETDLWRTEMVKLEEMEFDIWAYSIPAGQWLSGLTHFPEPKAFCVHLLPKSPLGDGLICLLIA